MAKPDKKPAVNNWFVISLEDERAYGPSSLTDATKVAEELATTTESKIIMATGIYKVVKKGVSLVPYKDKKGAE